MVDDVLKCTVFTTLGNQNCVTSWHWKITAQTVEDHLICPVAINEIEQLGFFTAFAGLLHDSGVVIGARLDSKKDDTINVPGILPLSIAGTLVGDQPPPYLTCNCFLYTASANFRHRGLIHFPAGNRAQIDYQTQGWSAARIAEIESFLENDFPYEFDLNSCNLELCLPATLAHDALNVIARNVVPTPGLLRSRRARAFGIG
jgi:hypothetical protein